MKQRKNLINKERDLLIQELKSKEFELIKPDSILAKWLLKHFPEDLEKLKSSLSKQSQLGVNMEKLISAGFQTDWEPVVINTDIFSVWTDTLDNSIGVLERNEELDKLIELKSKKIFFEHKKKLNAHFEKIKNSIFDRKWIERANQINFGKRSITAAEKKLSDQFFNQKYIEAFNHECENLNGNFGIDVSYTGSAGKSFRELKLKGKNPNAILSEGEQKVIALADFIAEMKMSLLNCGIIMDDPVSSLDEYRKSKIAHRLVKESEKKQVIIFTHDLVFLSSLIDKADFQKIPFNCHWIENTDGKNPGTIWLNNTPSFEKEYKSSAKARKLYAEAKKSGPEEREQKLKNGFAALRTSYESLVVFELFKGTVQRFAERISMESLKNVNFSETLKEEILNNFGLCCRYMEGHSHSDKYAYRKPELINLREECDRFDELKKMIKNFKG